MNYLRSTVPISAIIILVGVFALIRPTFGKISEPPCCVGKNILGKACIHNGVQSRIMLDCEHGKYMLDPYSNEPDNFTVDRYGELHVLSHDDPIPRYGYCTTNYLPVGSNETRKVAMVCFTGDYKSVLIFFFIKGILAFISVLFLMITLYVYWLLPELRETQDKVTCLALFCLMTFLSFLGVVQIVLPDKLSSFCIPFAYIIYFFTIAYFSWLNLIMLNVWKTSVLPKWKIKERTWYYLNHVYGWSMPISLCAAVYISQHLEGGFDPGFGVKSCWFAEKLEAWIFLYLPISIMLFVNLILFLWSIWGLHKHGNDISSDKKRAMAYKCKLYLKLFILAGLNWTLEVLSYHFGSHFELSWFWIFADVCNALHGVLIFFVLIIWRRRVRKELAGKQILCFKGPERWANVKYAEEEHLREQEEDNTKFDFYLK